MIPVLPVFGGAVLDQEISDPLHVLSSNAKYARDLRHGMWLTGRGAEDLPPRLSLSDSPGDRFALITEAARYLINVRHDDRH